MEINQDQSEVSTAVKVVTGITVEVGDDNEI